MQAVIWIVSGFLAGALARFVMRGQYRGFLGDVALGSLGSVIAAWGLRVVRGEVPPGGITHLLTAVVGAMLLVASWRLALIVLRGAERLASESTALAELEAQIQRLSDVERHVLSRVLGKGGLSHDSETIFREQLTLGERIADRVAVFGGSWTFLGLFAAFMLGWMFLNTQAQRPADPYPFILLNLILSCLAAVQAPVIMMSQNRQAAKDRVEAQQDYQVNLRAEMQIAALHLKIEEMRSLLEGLTRTDRALDGRDEQGPHH